jgi:hypothetical protein
MNPSPRSAARVPADGMAATPGFVPFDSDAQVSALAAGFCDRSLPKEQWTHAGHFSTTLALLATREDLDLSRDLPQMIRAYNASVGGVNDDHAGYHETITQASIRAARWFRAAHPHLPLFACCNALMETSLGRSDWLLAHWSRERLFSVEARRGWVEPDLDPLPF